MRRIVIAGALLFWAIGCVFVFRSATPNHPDLIGILAVLAVVVPFVLAIAVYAVKEMVWFAKRRRDRQRGFPVEMPAQRDDAESD